MYQVQIRRIKGGKITEIETSTIDDKSEAEEHYQSILEELNPDDFQIMLLEVISAAGKCLG